MSEEKDEKKEVVKKGNGVPDDVTGSTHIYLIIDTTGSMGSYIESLNKVLDQILTMINILFAGKTSLHCIQYKDYCSPPLIAQCHDNTQLKEWIRINLKASGGGDEPEAAKTALNELYEYIIAQNGGAKVTNDAITLVYTDAPPHHDKAGSTASNINGEKEALKTRKPGFDWVNICAEFKKIQMPFYTFLASEVSKETKSYWKLLGYIIEMPDVSVNTITRATIGVFNQIIGANKNTKFKYADNFKLLEYMDNALLEIAQDYDKLKALNELSSKGLIPGDEGLAKWDKVEFSDLPTLVFLADNLENLPMKLLYDKDFLDIVFAEFDTIMTADNIDSFSYNSVFSTMWRYLCRFKDDPRLIALKAKLVTLVNALNGSNKDIMNEWILESEKQLKLEIEKTEGEIQKAKDIGKAIEILKKSIRDIMNDLRNDKKIIINNPTVVHEIQKMEDDTIKAKNALIKMKEMTVSESFNFTDDNPVNDEPDEKIPVIQRKTAPSANVDWKTKKLKKWTTEDVLEWVNYIGVPEKWRKIMV
eukprot:317681_1